MNNQIEATYDGQATYPHAPIKFEAASHVHIKTMPMKLPAKKPMLTEHPLPTKEPAPLSESLDHYLYW